MRGRFLRSLFGNPRGSGGGKRAFPLPLLLAVLVLLSSSCGRLAGYEKPEDGVLIYAALNPVTNAVQVSVDDFNKNHEDVRIEIRDYSDEGGIQRLMVELALGQVPDIMEMHRFGEGGEVKDYGYKNLPIPNVAEGEYWMPYRNMAIKEYLEDLWPYIESDPELGRDALLEAPLKAAEVNGGLFICFGNTRITTLMGSDSVVGDRTGWTFQELMEVFSAMPEGSTILRYTATKWEVFSQLIRFSLDKYIDWDAGKSNFDCEEFRGILEFLNTFPTEFKTHLDPEGVEEEFLRRVTHGEQLLEVTSIGSIWDFIYLDAFWGGSSAYPGYPTADGSPGSMFILRGRVLAMSAVCKNKAAAWEYIRELLAKRYGRGWMKNSRLIGSDPQTDILVNRANYDLANSVELEYGKTRDVEKDPHCFPPWRFMGKKVELYPTRTYTEEDVQRLDALVNSTTQIYWPDDKLSDIVWDTIGAYFAGDRSLDATVKLIDNRVRMYIWERK